MLAVPSLRAEDGHGEAPIGFEAFALLVAKLAKAHREGGRENPDAYLANLAALASRLRTESVPSIDLRRYGGFEPPVELGTLREMDDVTLQLWRLAPGARFPARTHGRAHVLTLCLEGECWVKHYEIVGEAPDLDEEGTFRVKKTYERLLRASLTSSLTTERDPIQSLQAGPRGALGLHVTTATEVDRKRADWSLVEVDRGSREGFLKLYDARWLGRP